MKWNKRTEGIMWLFAVFVIVALLAALFLKLGFSKPISIMLGMRVFVVLVSVGIFLYLVLSTRKK